MFRRILLSLLAALGACVSVEPLPDPRGQLKPDQRIIIMVYQSPGPWIVSDPDSKAESALKLMPLGSLLQTMQEDKINELSKEIQPYLPRPRYDRALEAELIKAFKEMHGGPIQTAEEAGISPLQRKEWNAASDQLDWRRKYFTVEPGQRAPRNYSKVISLDDALIVDVNLSFGVEPNAEDRPVPTLTAATRLYRAETTRLMWAHEDLMADNASSSTLTEFRAAPSDLTDRLYSLSVPFARVIASSVGRSLHLIAAPAPVTVLPSPPAEASPGLPATPPPSLDTPPDAPPPDMPPPENMDHPDEPPPDYMAEPPRDR
ncbi:MAG: hypothetical protein AAB036_00640 [Elusimicrobiota bacterium]